MDRRNNNLLWGGLILLLGVLFLLQTTGLIHFNVASLIWPLFLIGLGLWFLWGLNQRGRVAPPEAGAVPLGDARRGRIHLHHGAGRLAIAAGAPADQLASGSFGGGLEYTTRRDGDLLDVTMQPRTRSAGPWSWTPGMLDWSVNLNSAIPLALTVESGANDARLDLTNLLLTDLVLKTGASSTHVLLPASAGFTRVRTESGVASVTMQVPAGVAAQIRIKSGLSGISVDTNRFPRQGDLYRSPDYDTAANKVEIEVETGVGSVAVS